VTQKQVSSLPLPDFYDPKQVGEIWKLDYLKLAHRAQAFRRQHHVPFAAEDRQRVCLILVDVQITFCIPGFELFVSGRSGVGAVEDNRRLVAFMYRNLGRITTIYPTMDTHHAMQIFHPIFWVNKTGDHPAPMTVITPEDLASGKWAVNPVAARNLRPENPEWLRVYAQHYVRTLSNRGKYPLIVWPYHAMLGGIGYALVPAVEQAVFFHTQVRGSQAGFQVKGDNPLTENYSVLSPEVLSAPDGKQVARKNRTFIDQLMSYDRVIVAGQAKSHCLAWTIYDLLDELEDPALARKVYLLEDCTSPVVVPGVADYTHQADKAFQDFKDAGMHVVCSSQPMEDWPA